MKECDDINFIGSVESREIPKGGADIIVCEAFVGNVILKLYEGLGSTLLGKIKDALMKKCLYKDRCNDDKIIIKRDIKSLLTQVNTAERLYLV